MASLKNIDPNLRKYLKCHRLTDIYEALLSGLAVMCPEDPIIFLIQKLSYLKENGMDDLEWDSFIDEEMRPKEQFLTESNLDIIFNFDDNLQINSTLLVNEGSERPKRRLPYKKAKMKPTAKMYEMAYTHYNNKIKTICFRNWMQHHMQKQQEKRDLEKKMKDAETHYLHRIYHVHLQRWILWVQFRKGRQAMAFNIIRHVYHIAVGRIIFGAWRNVTIATKKTREYFERLERGENMYEDEGYGGSGEARDDISMLPKDVIIKIFNHMDIVDLARSACVCRSWKVITQWSALWSKLNLARIRHKVTDQVAVKLLSKCRPYLIHLNLRGCNMIAKPTFTSVRECKNMQDLNLSECSTLNDDMMKIIAESCKILLYLNVSYTDITDVSLHTLAKNCNNIQYLSLAYCKRFTDRGLLYLATGKGAGKLVYLDFTGCIQITPNGFNNLAQGCLRMQTLVLNDLFTLDDLSIQYLTERVKSLRTISLLGSSNLSDESMKRLALGKKLRCLKIDNNEKISDTTLKYLGKHCQDLRQLYLTECQRITDLGLKALTLCNNLTVINLADCVRITDLGVRYLVESSCGARIKELNLTNCIGLSDVAVININKRCHSLAYLNLSFCEHIREAGIELLGQTYSLTSLDISGCNCGDVGLSALGSHHRFKQVNLSECVAITDLGLQKFAQQCTEIERLDLAHCQLVTDAAMKNLAFCCRLLTHLNIAGCRRLTDLSIQYLSGVCHYLQYLNISGSLHITDKALLKYLRKGCQHLNTLIMLYCQGISKDTARILGQSVEEVQHSNEEPPAYFSYLKFIST